MTQCFVHLRVHSEYSLVDGIVRIEPLIEAARELSMPAVALTDQCNLFALVKFYRAAHQAGVKPVIGADMWVHGRSASRLTLLCQDLTGYRNLTRLITRAYVEGQQRGIPLLHKEWLNGATQGLIALSGGREGDIGQSLLAGNRELAGALLHEWRALFPGRFYLELQRSAREGEEDYLHAALELALAGATPVVATNDVRFLRREDFETHEARVCIHEGRTLSDPRRPHHYSEQQYLKSAAEMAELFSDIPEALENTVHIARRCNLTLDFGRHHLPDYPAPGVMTVQDYLRAQTQAGLQQRLAELPAGAAQSAQQRAYQQRLEIELEVILRMGFAGYFLIVADFIQWAKQQGIPVGPGRGSGAGSLVAYALRITDLDPIHHGLLFERFLNPERVSLPDFDIDFCMERRDEVIAYVTQRYGRERVAQIITYGTMAAKAVVRDVGRVLGMPYGFVDAIAKLIPFDLGITLEQALKDEALLRERYQKEDEVRALIDLARRLEGITRNAGKHAGGVVIAPSDLTDFMPLFCEPGAEGRVTQLDKDDVETLGLVKFDFLGLRTLTIIDWAVKTLHERGVSVDIVHLPLDDRPTYDLLKRCATTAVFQLESRGMQDLIKRLQPDRFEEVVALVALFRPGPLQSGMVDDFIARKHGKKKVEYPHPELIPILQPTYGVILYQEQVMQIAQVLAGYTLGAADLLRRAMGKKKPEEMAKQRDIFQQGAKARGVDPRVAAHIFDLMEKFADYGFNKSHSVAYALIAYQTAWLKAHYPAAFMAAVLSSDMDNTDKVVNMIDECRALKLTLLPPDVNRCEYKFTLDDDQTLVYGLGAVKGVGQAAAESIAAARRERPFEDLFDLCARVELRKVNRRALEALIRAGALDKLGPGRATLMATLPEAISAAEQRQRNHSAGQDDLFGEAAQQAGPARRYAAAPEWSEDQRLAHEKETLGLYLSGHPLTRYAGELAQFTTCRLAELGGFHGKPVTVAGLVAELRTLYTRRGERMAVLTLDDQSARVEVALFAEIYQRYRDLLGKDKLLVVEGEVASDDYSGGSRITAERLCDIHQARAVYAKGLLIEIEGQAAGNGQISGIAKVLAPFRNGACPVRIRYQNTYNGRQVNAELPLGADWRVRPDDDLLQRLAALVGEQRVRVIY
ncbi:MAG: DNA polymerase III subunit alpha [Gammaproteobacteria bacterium]|nr:MAG: DNA polymerase III subunit alpha [Gammaproteobacteria bacterium]